MGYPPPPEGEPQAYKMLFPTATVPQECPVGGCRGQVATIMAIRVHFFHRYIRETIVVL